MGISSLWTYCVIQFSTLPLGHASSLDIKDWAVSATCEATIDESSGHTSRQKPNP
jgi:hypothetical protein